MEARLDADHLDVHYRGGFAEPVTGPQRSRINHRHVIWSLVKKPGACTRYHWRDRRFPTLSFRRTYDALLAWRGRQLPADPGAGR